ncbi:efflux RND transporter permease subunit [Planctomicrobium sp. SH668]|uniref:efflux RND transporter permease subunit n=1 Tax=Planctomicrobium sp. SH668 TaxID=3448126 RepID=UPI003F5C8F0E
MKDPWGHGLSLWVVALLLFLAPVSIYSLRNLRMDNSVESWLPKDNASALEYAWTRSHFPTQEILYLTWEGSTLDDPRLPVLLGNLHGKIDEDGIRRGGLPFVESAIDARGLLARMEEFGVDQTEAFRRLSGTMIGHGWLKVRLTEKGAANPGIIRDRLIASAADEFNISLESHEVVAPWTPAKSQVANFEKALGQFANVEADAPPVSIEFQPHDFQLSWEGISNQPEVAQKFVEWVKKQKGLFGSDLIEDCYLEVGSPVAVAIGLSEAGLAEKEKALAAIRDAASNSFIPTGDVVLAGGVVTSAELNRGVARAAWNPDGKSPWGPSLMGLSGLIGIIFALVSLKSIRLGLLVVGVSYYSALLGMSFVPMTGTNMNMVLVVMPTLLMVLSLSGAIHVANYWKHAAWEDPETAVSKATRMAFEPCLLSGLTTAIGLISLATSQLTPVREFGIYAAIGTLISMGMTLYGLPSLLQLIPQRPSRDIESNSKFWNNYSNFLCRHWKSSLSFTVVLCIVCTFGLMHFDVETKVIRYFPDQSKLVKDVKRIEDSLGGTCPIEILVRFDESAQDSTRFLQRVEMVRQIEEKIRQHAAVSGALSLADFLPERASPAETDSSREIAAYNRRSHESEKRVKAEDSSARNLLAMSDTGPFAANALTKGEDELWRINAQCSIINDLDYNTLSADLHAAVNSVIADKEGVDHFITGTVPLFLQTQHAVLNSLIWSFVLAFGMISIIMMWVLRDPLAGLISMLPNLLPVTMVFGLVSWFGQRIDIGTMVTASVALGISVDGTLHLLTWFQNGIRQGLTRQQSINKALAHCAPAMWQTSAAVGFGLVVLVFADLLLISRFGSLMAVLVFAAFMADIVMLPALLMGSLGKLIERGIHRRGEVVKAKEELAPLPIPAHHLQLGSPVVDESRFVG